MSPGELDLELVPVVAHLDLDLHVHLVWDLHGDATGGTGKLDRVVASEGIGECAEPCSSLLTTEALCLIQLEEVHAHPFPPVVSGGSVRPPGWWKWMSVGFTLSG